MRKLKVRDNTLFSGCTKFGRCCKILSKNNKKVSLCQLSRILRFDGIDINPDVLYSFIVENEIIDKFQKDTTITGYGVMLVSIKIKEFIKTFENVKYEFINETV